MGGVVPCPEAGLGIASPQACETPAGAVGRMVASNEAKKRARGPRIIERSEIMWGELKGRVAPRSSSQSIRDPKGRANALELAAKKSPAGAVPA